MADLNLETLKKSLEGGLPELKKTITQGSDGKPLERTERADQVRKTIALLSEASNTMKDSERKMVIEASRQVAQDELDAIAKEQRGDVDKKLTQLADQQKKFLEAKQDVLQAESKLATAGEKVVIEGREVMSNVKNSNDIKIAGRTLDGRAVKIGGYVLAATTAAAVGTWLWNHSLGWVWKKVAGEGKMEKMGKTITAALSAALGAVGLSHFLQSKETSKYIPPGVKGAGDALKKQGVRAFNIAAKNTEFLAGFSIAVSNGNGCEFLKENGGGIALENGKYVYHTMTGDVLDIDYKLGVSFMKTINEGKFDPELFNCWTGAGLTYVFSKGMFNLIIKGKVPMSGGIMNGIKSMTIKTILGPLEQVRDLIATVKAGFSEDAAKALKIQLIDSGRWKKIADAYRMRKTLEFSSAKNLEKCLEALNEMRDGIRIAQENQKFVSPLEKGWGAFFKSTLGITSGDTIKEMKSGYEKIGEIFHTAIRKAALTKKDGLLFKIQELANRHPENAKAFMVLLPEELHNAQGGLNMGAKVGDAVSDTTQSTNTAAKAAEYRKAAAGTVDAGADALKTAKGAATEVEAVEEVSKGFMRAKAEILAARATKSGAAVLEALQKYATVLQAAAQGGNRMAKALLAVFSLTRSGGKWAMKGLPIICTLIDAAMLTFNYFEIQKAVESGNLGMQQTLESKQQMLRIQAELGIGLFALGPQGLLILPSVIIGGYLANSIYDSVVTWDKTANDWMKESTEALDKKLQELPIGYVASGHKYGIMTHPLKRPFMSQEDREKEGRDIEKVNINVRQEILTAYFLKTMRVRSEPNETDIQKKDRIAGMVRQRLQYVGKITSGTYVRGDAGAEYYYGDAGRYAEMNEMRNSLQQQGQPELLTYLWNGQQKSIDLRALNYMRNPKSTDQEQMAFMKTMSAYRNEYSQIQEAVLDYQQELNSTDLALATPTSKPQQNQTPVSSVGKTNAARQAA